MKTEYEISKDTMTGDIRDAFLEAMRNLPKPWQQMSKSEKDDQTSRAEKASEFIVEKAVKLIASAECEKIEVRIKKYSDDGKKLKIELIANSEDAEKIVGLVDSPVMLVTNPSGEFKGQRAPVNNKEDDRQQDMFEQCNTEYQEADGEGIPNPVEDKPNEEDQAPIAASAPAEQLALPAPEVTASSVDENVVDAEYEEITAGEAPQSAEDEEQPADNDSPNPESQLEPLDNPDEQIDSVGEPQADYLDSLLEHTDPVEEAEQAFFEGNDDEPQDAA